MKITRLILFILIVALLSSCNTEEVLDGFKFDTGEVDSKGNFKVYLNLDGGTLDKEFIKLNINYTYSSLYSDAFIPHKDGCTFIGWINDEGETIEHKSVATHIKSAKAVYYPVENAQRIGGTIYYVSDDNGVTYRFFDEEGALIGENLTDLNVLANASWYVMDGSSNSDRYYVISDKEYGLYSFDTSVLQYAGAPSYSNSSKVGKGKGLSKELISFTQGNTTPSKDNAFIQLGNLKKEIQEQNNPTSRVPYDWYIGTTGEYQPITEGKSSLLYTQFFKDKNILTSSIGYSFDRSRYYTMIWYGNENEWRTNEMISTNPFSYGEFIGYSKGYIVPIRSF